MFRSVLAAADFRRQPDPAVLNGARLAHMTGARLHVLHCIPDGSEPAAHQLSVGELVEPGADLAMLRGEPHELIPARALAVDADVIVLGPRVERSPIHGLLGTTAEKVIQSSRIPCLLSNAPLVEPPHSILLAMDRSVPAREALRVCTTLIRQLSARGIDVNVHLLNVSAFAQPGRRWGPGWIDLRKYAGKMQSAVGSAVITHGVFSAPLPADGILDRVRSSSPDLLVLGTHGLGTVGRFLMGSVARNVANAAAVPILLVPPASDRRHGFAAG